MNTVPPSDNPSVCTIVNRLLKEAADRARWCGNSRDFLLYATAVSKLAAARQALSAQSLFSVPPEVLGRITSAPETSIPTPGGAA